MRPPGENTVLELDIRDWTVEAATDRVRELLHDLRWRRGAVRMVVIDDASGLADHESVYQAIQAGPNTHLVCVAIGAPADRPAGVALRTTQLLNNQTTATLWIGDPEGQSWPRELTPGHRAPLPSAPPEALRELREILHMSEVFDEVLRIVDGLPFRVASPGHLIAAGQVGPLQLAAAQLASVHQIAGDRSGAHRPGPERPAVDYWPLITTEQRHDADPTRLRADKPLRTMQQAADELLRTGRNEVVAVDGPVGPRWFEPPTPVLDDAQRAGRQLAEFYHAVRDLFGRIDEPKNQRGVRNGLSEAARDRLSEAGINMRELAGAGHREIAARWKDALTERFHDGMPLRDMAQLSKDLSDHATTAGSRGRLADLDAACPGELLDRLTDPPRLPWRVVNPWVLAVVTVCGLLAALAPFGLVIGSAVALVWSVVVFATTLHRPTIGDRPIRFDPDVLTHLGAAMLGVGTGASISGTQYVPVPVGWAALVIAVAGLVLTLKNWWSWATRRWGLEEALLRGQRANEDVLTLLCQVAVTEWVAGEPRDFLARGAYAIAEALDDVAGALAAWVPATRPDAPIGDRTPASDELQRLITADVRHVVDKALDESWRTLAASTSGEFADDAGRRTRNLLDDYSMHLEHVGIDEPFQPDQDDVRAARTDLVRRLWQQSSEINWLMYEAGADSAMVQLCGPEDLPLLDGSRERFGLIRFAPRAARESVTAACPVGRPDIHITWTGAAHIAGVLRLVPLGSRTVTGGWSSNAQETDVYQ